MFMGLANRVEMDDGAALATCCWLLVVVRQEETMARGGAWAAAAAVWWMAAGAGAVWLEIAPSGTKCVSEEIQSNVVVIGDYSVLYDHHHAHPTIAVKVTSPFGDIVHKKEKVSMEQFAFTTAEAGNYLVCFSIDGEDRGLVVKLNLDWKIGIATRDWDSVAKMEKIEVKYFKMRCYTASCLFCFIPLPYDIKFYNQGVELELLKLEVAVQPVHDNLLLLKSKEADLRDVSEKTNSRVTWLSMLSLSVCIAVSVLQLWHLQQYFRKKKLI